MSAPVKISSPATKEFWEIPVLCEDEHLFALDKPAGLLVAPELENDSRPNLLKLLHEGIAQQKPWAHERHLDFLQNANHLDFESSGILLFAKNKTAFQSLADFFGAENRARKFVALVWGNPPEKNFSVDAKLAPHPIKPGEMSVDPRNGKKSKTEFAALESFSDWSLLNGFPLTDRPHQIRVHAKYAGFPIVGDETYHGKKLWLSRLKRDFRLKTGREERPLISRAALHLEALNFPHPITKETVAIKSEWPKDLKVAIKYLRQYATGPSRRGQQDEPELEQE